MATKRQVAYKRDVRKKISGNLIDKRVKGLGGDWRAEMLSHFRIFIKQADPKAVEEVKWIKATNPLGTATWSHEGKLICTFETYASHVRLTFLKGASLKDPKGVFNSGFAGNSMRAIVLHEGEKLDEKGFKDLFRSAVALNTSQSGQKT